MALVVVYLLATNPLLKWNDVGNICEDWTVEELTKLAMEIDAYVTPLVEKQQAYEKNGTESI